ncbi:hypothetical protein [Candidatus Rhodobacter oscarellae]|nr:hypothetical protein [Candidatus Rhodobacter lobularis]
METGLSHYKRRAGTPVIAVQMNLETQGLTYQKWGGTQRAHSGDWIVNNNGECYTVSADSFAATYSEVAPGQYIKTGDVWARQASEDGATPTKEGATAYKAGDMLVFNDPDAQDGYAMSLEKFQSLYEPA